MQSPGRSPRVGKHSFVDESLFGKSNSVSKSQSWSRESVDTVDHPTIHGPRRTRNNTSRLATLSKSADFATLKKTDLDRMMKPSPILTAEDVATLKKEVEHRREQAQAISKARKDRMILMEEEAKKNLPPTVTSLLKQQADVATLSRAQQLLQEQKDDVKRMNQMMLYSKCVTIRDAQLEEKRQLMQENDEESRKLDLMMEIERIKAIESAEALGQQRLEERRRGAQILADQIQERERERLRQAELRDLERVQMLQQIEQMKEAELQAQIEKKLQAKELMEQVAAANTEQIKRKELMKIRERQEELKIAQYLRAKEMRERVSMFWTFCVGWRQATHAECDAHMHGRTEGGE